MVFSSPSKRTMNTAYLLSEHVQVSQDLSEILFSLKESVPSELTSSSELLDVNALRFELMNSFVAGNVIEKPSDLRKRMAHFHEIILSSKDDISLCVSHAFVMKCYEIFYSQQTSLFDNSLYAKLWDWKTKPYDFLGGFVVLIGLDTIEVLPLNLEV